MKNSIALVAAAFLCLVAFPTTTVGKYWPKIEGWPNPSEVSGSELMFLNTGHRFSYGDSKVWKCTYSNGSAPAISISPSTPYPSTPSNPSPSTPSPSTPSPSTPSPSTPSPSTPSPSTPSTPSKPSPSPPTPKTSPPPPSPSPPPSIPKKSPPPAPKKSPPPPTPSLPPPTPKKAPSPPPSDDQPSNPPPKHHHSHHHHQNRWEHMESCMRNMGPVGLCRMQMEASFYTRMFRVSKYCCNLVVNMRNECDDVAWGFFTDPFFLPLVRYTCHVTC